MQNLGPLQVMALIHQNIHICQFLWPPMNYKEQATTDNGGNHVFAFGIQLQRTLHAGQKKSELHPRN